MGWGVGLVGDYGGVNGIECLQGHGPRMVKKSKLEPVASSEKDAAFQGSDQSWPALAV